MNNRNEILKLALDKINQGCCYQYVSAGLREWHNFDISPGDLEDELSKNPGMLPADVREHNSWEHIFHDDTNDLETIDLTYLGKKYGYSWRYLDSIISAYCDGRKCGRETARVQENLARGWMSPEQAVQQLIDNTCLSEDEAQEEVTKIMEEIKK